MSGGVRSQAVEISLPVLHPQEATNLQGQMRPYKAEGKNGESKMNRKKETSENGGHLLLSN
jgi:hypothetical protein